MAERSPLFVQRVRQQQDEHVQVEVWFQDEARFGQQGTLTHVWAQKGSRPTAVKQTEYEWVYLFASVNPLTGESSAMLAPTVNTDYMNEHLRFISEQVGRERHVVLVMDQAGWHLAKALQVPPNITLLLLPPYSPDLNPIEQMWSKVKQLLRQRAARTFDALIEAIGEALACVTATDCRGFFAGCGYAQEQS